MKALLTSVAAVLILASACGPGEEEDPGFGGGPSTSQGKKPSQLILGTWKDSPQTFSGGGRSFELTMRMIISANGPRRKFQSQTASNSYAQ